MKVLTGTTGALRLSPAFPHEELRRLAPLGGAWDRTVSSEAAGIAPHTQPQVSHSTPQEHAYRATESAFSPNVGGIGSPRASRRIVRLNQQNRSTSCGPPER